MNVVVTNGVNIRRSAAGSPQG